MALTTLDPKTALLIVDLQKGLIDRPFIHPAADILARAPALAYAFRARLLPTVLINVAGAAPGRTEQAPRHTGPVPDGFTDFLPELGQQPSDIVITKRRWGAFAGTDLEARLKALRVTQVVVAGVATATGVESTARQAYEAGYNVTLAIDAMSDSRAEAHEHSLRHIFPRLGETGPTEEIISLLSERSA